MCRKAISFCVLITFCLSLGGCSAGLSSKRDSNIPGMEIILGGLAGAAVGGLAGSGSAGGAMILAGGLFGAVMGSLIEKRSAARPQSSKPSGIPAGKSTTTKDHARSYDGTFSSGAVSYPATGTEGTAGQQSGEGMVIDLQSVFRPSQPSSPPALPSEKPADVPALPEPARESPSKDNLKSEEKAPEPADIPAPEPVADKAKTEPAEEPSGRDTLKTGETKTEIPSEVEGDSAKAGSSVMSFIDRLLGFEGFTESSPVLEDIFFDFEKDELSSAAVATLSRNIRILRDYPDMTVRIESFVGQYENIEFTLGLELSERRAHLVKDYLTLSGISPGRLKTKSFGRTMPLLQEAGGKNNMDSFEARLNRRVHFEVETYGSPSGIFRLFE